MNLIESDIQVIDIWADFFHVLSVERFKVFWADLGLNIPFNPHISIICKDFSVSYFNYFRRKNQQDLIKWDTSVVDNPTMFFLKDLANHTLERISDVCGIELIYSINSWYRRSMDYFSEEFSNGSYNQLYGNIWFSLFDSWVSKKGNFPSLSLSKDKMLYLYDLARKTRIKKYRALRKFREIVIGEDSWEKILDEETALKSYMLNQARYTIQIHFWEQLLSFYSDEELSAIQNWGWEIFKLNNINILPPILRISFN